MTKMYMQSFSTLLVIKKTIKIIMKNCMTIGMTLKRRMKTSYDGKDVEEPPDLSYSGGGEGMGKGGADGRGGRGT